MLRQIVDHNTDRQENMEKFILWAQAEGKKFSDLVIAKCPELMSNEAQAYIRNDMQTNVDLYFDEALEDAKEAREIQLRPDSIANVFDVTERQDDGKATRIDLQDIYESRIELRGWYKDRYEESRQLTLQAMPVEED